jgi:hypothetical protein
MEADELMGSFLLSTAVSWEGYTRFHDIGDVGYTATCAIHADWARRGQDTEKQRWIQTGLLVNRSGLEQDTLRVSCPASRDSSPPV